MNNILHLITTIERGGAEKQLVILARNQTKLGNKVTVLPLKGNPHLYNEFIESGVNVELNAINKSIFKQLVILINYYRKNVFEVIHAHLPRAELFTAILRIFTHCNYVITRHNAERFYPDKPQLLSILLSRFTTLRARNIIAISDYVRTFLLESSEISRDKSIVNCLYGYDDKRLIIEQPRKISKSKGLENFVTLSRLAPQKDLTTMIRGFAKFRLEQNKGFLRIYGNGNQLENLTQLSTQLQVSNFVSFHENVSNVDEILRNADCFLLTSKYEGFGLVLLECMQLALPVICSKNSAILEVMGENYNGYFNTGDFESLRDAIYKVSDPTFYTSLSKYLISRVAFFDPSKTATCVLKNYL